MASLRCWLAALTLLPVAACGAGDVFGPSRNAFPPVCPAPRLIPALADLTRFAGAGPQHDITDLVVQGRVVSVNGSCTTGNDPSVLPTVVRITIALQRGPAMKGREIDVPVFLAVSQNEDVRDKQVYPVHAVFPPNVDSLSMTSPDIKLNLPLDKGVSGASYGLIAGFQLSPDELQLNRQRGG